MMEIKTFSTLEEKSQINIDFEIEIMINLLTLCNIRSGMFYRYINIFFPISEKNMDACMIENPWLVESIDAFFYFLKIT